MASWLQNVTFDSLASKLEGRVAAMSLITWPGEKSSEHEFGTFLGGFVSKILLDIDIPSNFGWKMIQFDERAGFFQMGGEKPPTRYSNTWVA